LKTHSTDEIVINTGPIIAMKQRGIFLSESLVKHVLEKAGENTILLNDSSEQDE